MALTKADLLSIRGVVDEAIAEHPRFDVVVDDMAEQFNAGLKLIDQRFDIVEQRLDRVEHRLDNLRIVSNS